MAEGETTALDLSYDPDELLVAAPAGLARFVASARARPNAARVVPDAAEGAVILREKRAIRRP
jgi:hypothetical protein